LLVSSVNMNCSRAPSITGSSASSRPSSVNTTRPGHGKRSGSPLDDTMSRKRPWYDSKRPVTAQRGSIGK